MSLNHISIFCDNTSTISLIRNPIQYSRTKHIEIRHHLIREYVQKGDVDLNFISIDSQLADIFTKPLHEDKFSYIRKELEMINLD